MKASENSRPVVGGALPEPEALADGVLRQALRGLPPAVPPERIDALNQRVLAQWQEGRRTAAAVGVIATTRPWLTLWGAGGGRAPWVAGATGLALGVALLLGSWLQTPDPALEELLQLDVLSQMAAGEM